MPLAVGRGLDRNTGSVSVSPAAPIDARNVYARDAKMALRPGMAGTGFPPLAWGTDIIGVFGMRSTLDVLFVVFDRVSRDIRIYRLDTETAVLQTILSPVNGLWGTLDLNAEFPIVTAAEADGLMMFAHAEPDFALRLPTIYYTPDVSDTAVGTLAVLTADLVGDGVAVAAPIYFAGVYAYTDYIAGWGFGSVNDPDRGDILRLCQPTAPLDWRPPNYAIFGVKKDSIIACCATAGPSPVGASGAVVAGITSVLVVCKTDESYILNGTSFDNFAPQLLDSKFGVMSPRAMQNVGGVAYGWASDGGRVFSSQTTTPVAQPLELVSPLPADFAPRGPGRECFSSYDSDRKLVSWLFPDTESAAVPVAEFMLSLWNPQDPRWTFSERQQPVTCSGILFARDTGSLPPAPIGFVSTILANDAGIATDPRYRSINLQWTNNKQTGTELVQLFARPSGGAWALQTSFAVGGDADQQATWDTALPVTAYDLALRYANEQTPATGYESDDPDLWTAPTAPGSKGSVVTTSAAVTWVGGSFTDPSTPVNLVWASAQQGAPYLLEKSNDGGSTYTTVAADLVATTFAYAIPPAEVGTTVRFRLTAQRDAVVGPTAGTFDVPMVISVAQPTWGSATWTPATRTVALLWNPATNAVFYLVEKSTDGGSTWASVATVPAANYSYPVPDGELNITLNFRVTGINGVHTSPASAAEPVATPFAIGVAVVTLGALNAVNRQLGVQPMTWTPATNAATYLCEYSFDGGATWNPFATVSSPAANYPIQEGDVTGGATFEFRVTGQSGSISGAASTPVSTDFTTMVLGHHTFITLNFTGYNFTSGVRYANFTFSYSGNPGDVLWVELWSAPAGTNQPGADTSGSPVAPGKAGYTNQIVIPNVPSGSEFPATGGRFPWPSTGGRAFVGFRYLGQRYMAMSADATLT